MVNSVVVVYYVWIVWLWFFIGFGYFELVLTSVVVAYCFPGCLFCLLVVVAFVVVYVFELRLFVCVVRVLRWICCLVV